MKDKTNECPLCMSKMHSENGALVCPECGYRLCDHSYESRNTYSTQHSHEAPKTSYSQKVSYTGQTVSGQTSPRTIQTHTGTQRNYPPASRNSSVPSRKLASVITVIIVIYFIIMLFSILFPSLETFFYLF